MTTTYRVLIQCDELSSAWCCGMLELSGPTSRVTSEAAFFPLEQGWLRGYGVDQTWDVCPACQTPVLQRVLELGGPFPRLHDAAHDLPRLPREQEGKTEKADRCAQQAEAGRRGGHVDGGDTSQDRRNEQEQKVDAGH